MEYKRIVIAGQELYNRLQAEKEQLVSQTALGFNSEELCKLQIKRSGQGITEIEIVKSMYGYSVRYASGLQNFGLLRPSRGAKDNSLLAAEQYCKDWVAESPEKRFATMVIEL